MGEIAWVDLDDPPEPLLHSTAVGIEMYRAWLETGRFQAH